MRDAIAGAVMALLALTLGASADGTGSYPNKPLMLMVAFGAGGATNHQARIVTEDAGALGMPIAILNKPGNGGRDGWGWFADHAPPDGYALAVYNVPHFIAQSIHGGVSYGLTSFEPIANWGADPAVLIVPAESEIETLEDLVRLARADPGAVTVSGAGLHTGHHIATLQLQKAARISLAFTPSADGGATAMKTVIRGEVMAGVNNLSDATRAIAEGHVRVLGIFDTERHAFLPDVPTFQEQGYAIDDASVNYRGIMVPSGTPQQIVDQLADVIPKMFAQPDVVAKMGKAGASMRIMTRPDVQRMWQEQQRTLEKLLEDL